MSASFQDFLMKKNISVGIGPFYDISDCNLDKDIIPAVFKYAIYFNPARK